MFIFFALFCSLNVCFSQELSNQSADVYLDNDEVLSSGVGDVYFDSNALVDGDGSENNPYKNLNPTSLQNCNIAHLKNREYNLSNVIYVSNNIEFVGENSNNTLMKNDKINNSQFLYIFI